MGFRKRPRVSELKSSAGLEANSWGADIEGSRIPGVSLGNPLNSVGSIEPARETVRGQV